MLIQSIPNYVFFATWPKAVPETKELNINKLFKPTEGYTY